jgi:hypothetical protein
MTPCKDPIPEPNNDNDTLRPLTKMNTTPNPKYGFVETFDRIPFTETTEKMRYCRPDGRSVNRSRKEVKRPRSSSWHSRPILEVQPRKLGGPNTKFLNRYGLDKTSHPMY